MFSPLCPLLRFSFYLNLSGRSGKSSLLSSPVLSGYNGPSDTRFSWETMRQMSWPNGEHSPCLLQSLVVFLLLSPVSILFLEWRRTVPSKFSATQVPPVSTEELVLPHHACRVLSRLRCNGCSLLLISYLSSVGRIENPSCSACKHSSQYTSRLILHCPATSSLHRSLYKLWSSPWGIARQLRLHGLPPFFTPRKGSGNNNSNNKKSSMLKVLN